MPLVPVVIQQDARGERSFDIYSRLLRERDVFFTPEQARDYGLVDQVRTYRNGNGYPSSSPSSS